MYYGMTRFLKKHIFFFKYEYDKNLLCNVYIEDNNILCYWIHTYILKKSLKAPGLWFYIRILKIVWAAPKKCNLHVMEMSKS